MYLNFILTYNSIRYKQFFDIIKFVCKFTIELQIELKIKQFERWLQKLLNCKN